MRRPYVVHAVASPDVGGEPCLSENAGPECVDTGRRRGAICGASAIGREYYELAEALGGEEISVCVQDWGAVFGPLLEAVTPTDIPCSIDLDSDIALDATQVAIRTGDSSQPVTRVAGPTECDAHAQAFYSVDGQGDQDGPRLTLCARTCDATQIDGIELDIATHCD